jgi:phosphoglycolate phosphatase
MFGLDSFFEFVDGGDVHIKKYMQLERLVAGGIDAATTIMIGDRAVDIEAAKINGIGSIGVSWGFGDLEELENACADHVVHTPVALTGLFL